MHTFQDWKSKNRIKEVTEDVILAFLDMRSQKLSPCSLWPEYSMLKATLKSKENIDIEKFGAVISYIKKLNVGYRGKKYNVLTREEIKTFLQEADDGEYLFEKFALIFGIAGACRKAELCAMRFDDIQDCGSDFATAGPSKKRSFVSPAETQEERPPKRRPRINPQSIHPQPPPRSPSPIIAPFIFPYFIPNPVGHIPIPHIPTPAHLDPPRRFRPRVPAHSRAVRTLLPLFMAQAPSSQKTVPPGTELLPLPDMDDGVKPLSEYQAFCVWRAQWERQYYQERRLTHRTLDAALFLDSYYLSLDGGFSNKTTSKIITRPARSLLLAGDLLQDGLLLDLGAAKLDLEIGRGRYGDPGGERGGGTRRVHDGADL
ncbi:hypothetical protein Zmor_017531 [Zophobas morio]|uniref:Uncharacterized protein n=1 Tax=Zophobas morio TaxID=2755281 RepID=A0AA38I9S5_9CUCU|nr:hypothetical protein Zmor_017531 [Zophobas morio]